MTCVLYSLHYVDFSVHIIGRSPGLQKIDKLIPLRLSDFWIVKEQMTINNLIVRWNRLNGVEFETNGKTFSRQRGESREDKMKKFVNFFFCGRSIIHVHELCWCDGMFQNFLPVDMKFRVNSLTAISYYFNTAIPFIDPRSFPLKTLCTSVANTSIFDIQVVKLTETLLLNLAIDRIVTVEDLKKLNNKTVIFKHCRFTRIDLISLIKYHIETKKDIRTTFVIPTDCKGFINNMLREFNIAFGKFRCDLKGVNERYVK